MPPRTADIEITPEIGTAISHWQTAKQELNEVKNFERDQRLEIVKLVPWPSEKQEGSQTVGIGSGWRLSMTRTLDYAMSKDNTAIDAALEKLRAINPEKAAALILRYEAVMSTEVYKTLSEEEKIILADVVTIKPGMPQLEMKPPTQPKA